MNLAYTSSLLLHTIIASGQVDMSLDGQEGRQLIRVILQFIMSDDPQLTSKSVKLLIRQFSQRKELIARFKQVRMHSCMGSSDWPQDQPK